MAYTYEPLPQDCYTRVLELHPALDPDSTLRGNFRNMNREAGPFYDAISYTWGALNFTEEILIGEEHLSITENLRDALVRFRHPTEIRSIWADAICIDQKNDEEKGRQIPSMKDIYRCASSVLVWLGKLPVAEACLREISLLSQRKTIMTTGSDMVERISSELNRLVSIPWFNRRWVIQEIVMNPCVTFFSCTISVPWLRILQLLHLVPKKTSSPPILHLHALREMWETHNRIGPPDSNKSKTDTTGILHLLSIFNDADCADARDRVYALAGVASDVVFDDNDNDNSEAGQTQRKIVLSVDYTKSVDQVYCDFAVAVLKSWRTHSYIRLLAETNRRANGFHIREPSWVPDWRLPIARPEIESISMLELARGFFSDWAKGFKVPRTRLTGEIMGQISTLYPPDADRPTQLAWLRSVFTSIKESHTDYQKDFPMDPKTITDLWCILGGLLTFWPEVRFLGRYKPYGSELRVFDALERKNVGSSLDDYCLFTISVDKKKYRSPLIGIGPCHVEVGDLVYYAAPETDGQIFQKNHGIVLRETNESRTTRLHELQRQQGGQGTDYVESRTCYFVGLIYTMQCPLRSHFQHYPEFIVDII
ncbi:heterokaryon incompatibility protein-domain-containing protein [Xylaria curta]|nr:heterokaryon incompatibility protein-domain-containing protein [Xylaria curta]